MAFVTSAVGKLSNLQVTEIQMAKGTCDVCEAEDVELSRGFVTGIETFACAKCCGNEPDDQEPDEKWDEKHPTDRDTHGQSVGPEVK